MFQDLIHKNFLTNRWRFRLAASTQSSTITIFSDSNCCRNGSAPFYGERSIVAALIDNRYKYSININRLSGPTNCCFQTKTFHRNNPAVIRYAPIKSNEFSTNTRALRNKATSCNQRGKQKLTLQRIARLMNKIPCNNCARTNGSQVLQLKKEQREEKFNERIYQNRSLYYSPF